MEDPKGEIPPELGVSQRKPRKKKEEPAPVMTPSKLRTTIKPSSRGNGDFAASATRRRGENLDREDRIRALSGGISDQPPAAQGHQTFMLAPSKNDSRDKLGANVASPKTPGSSKTEARSIPSATVDEDSITDIFSPEFRPNNDSPSVGRLSTALQEILKDGLRELDKVAKRISVETGLSVPQVKERWRVKDGRTVSPWNIYQEYFGAHVEEELARLPKEAIKMVRGKATSDTVAAAWVEFKNNEPETYQMHLQTWNELQEFENPPSLTARTRDFAKFESRLRTIVDYGSSSFGFESVVLAAGKVVHQDQSLAMIYESESAKEFFSERLDLGENTVLGHFRSHLYHNLSRKNKPTFDSKTESTREKKLLALDYSEVEENADKLVEIKNLFVFMAEKAGLTINRKSFLWKSLANTFSKSGLVLYNYPEDVPFPSKCDKKKGIACLNVKEQKRLIDAFRHSEYPMKLTKAFKDRVPEDQPVIIGVPPPNMSDQPRGRRLFLDPSRGEDRMGLMRQAEKDTQALIEAEDVSTNRKIKHGAQIRSPEVGLNDEGVTMDEDASPGSSEGSPILSAQARRIGNAYSKPIQKTSNANIPKSPIIAPPLLQKITPTTPSKSVRFEVGDQQEHYTPDDSIAPLAPPTAESSATAKPQANFNKRKVSDLHDADEPTSPGKKMRPETIYTAHSALSRTDSTEQAESPSVTAPVTVNGGSGPKNANISPPVQGLNHPNSSYDQPTPVLNPPAKYPSQERELGTNQDTTGEPTMCSPRPGPDTEASSQAAGICNLQASRERSPLNVNPAQVNNTRLLSGTTLAVQNPDGSVQAYDPGLGREMLYNTYAPQWDPMSQQYAYSYPHGASDYHLRQEFFSRNMGPPPPIPPRPGSGVSAATYQQPPGPPVYPQMPGPTAGYYHMGPPEQPSGYHAARPGPPALNYPQTYTQPQTYIQPQTYTQPFYRPQMPGSYQQPQSGAAPLPRPDSSLPHPRQDDHNRQGGHQIPLVVPAVQDGAKLEN